MQVELDDRLAECHIFQHFVHRRDVVHSICLVGIDADVRRCEHCAEILLRNPPGDRTWSSICRRRTCFPAWSAEARPDKHELEILPSPLSNYQVRRIDKVIEAVLKPHDSDIRHHVLAAEQPFSSG